VLQAMYVSGIITPDSRALSFGRGREPLPSLLASRGMTVLATDASIELDKMQGWTTAGQHSQAILDLYVEGLVTRDVFLDRVSFRPVDMTAIPPDLIDFDVCWSSCCLEHLGSIAAGLRSSKKACDVSAPAAWRLIPPNSTLTQMRPHLKLKVSNLSQAGH